MVYMQEKGVHMLHVVLAAVLNDYIFIESTSDTYQSFLQAIYIHFNMSYCVSSQ